MMKDAEKAGLWIIVGLGKTGMSCVRYLVGQGCNVAVTDSRAIPPCVGELRENFPQVPIYIDGYDDVLLSKADHLVMSPGVSLKTPVIAKQIARGITPIGDIELFVRAAKAPIIAITGSNGKSTVTTLVGEMAVKAGRRVCVGGNLGTPVLGMLRHESPELYVLELSSFQLETTQSLTAAAAVNLNVSPDHMDRYENFAEYVCVKQSIYQNCDHAIVNRDDPVSFNNVNFESVPISFGANKPGDHAYGLRESLGRLFLAYGEKNLLPTDELKIKGHHQFVNALASLALGRAVGLPMDAMISALREFTGLAHRCQWVATINHVDWYNDSKGTNVGATQAAIEGLGQVLPGKLILIAGGISKHADFSPLQKPIAKFVREVILFGQDKLQLAKILQADNDAIFVEGLQEAVKRAHQLAAPGDAVLLSPACASFDMFTGFEQRGEVFCAAVRGLQ